MQGLASDMLEATPRLERHLDHCLGCRACESVCPAEVPYGELIDAGRALLQTRRTGRNRMLRWAGGWLAGRRRRRTIGRLLRLFQRLQLMRIGGLIFPRLTSLLPQISAAPGPGHYEAIGRKRGRVQLFTGCVSELVDGSTLRDCVEVLNHCGFEVELPKKQGCCGALHQHNGLQTGAQPLFEANLAAFGASDVPVLGTATGCTAMLREYEIHAPGNAAAAFSARIEDIGSFLARHWPKTLSIQTRPVTAWLHEPCSQRNVLGGFDSVMRLLHQIPGLEIQPLPGNTRCCGAAGSMMLTDAAQADLLLGHKLDAIEASPPEYLLTGNIGCAMHIAGGLRRRGLNVEVLHPVSLLARLLRR